MTPKEKAAELIKKMDMVVGGGNYDAKEYALIAVDEILESIDNFEIQDFYKEVKQEIIVYIEKLQEETIENKYLIEWINENYPTMIEGGNSTLIEFDYYDADKFANHIEKFMKERIIAAFENGKYNANPDNSCKLISGKEYYKQEINNL